MCSYDGRFKLLTWQCVHSNSSVNDFISLIVPFRLFCTHREMQEKAPNAMYIMSCWFVMFGDLSIFVRIPSRNFKCEVFLWLMCKSIQNANKQTKPWCTNVFTSSVCCYVFPCDLLNILGTTNTPVHQFTLLFSAWRWAGHCASLTWFYLIPFSKEPRKAVVGNSFG